MSEFRFSEFRDDVAVLKSRKRRVRCFESDHDEVEELLEDFKKRKRAELTRNHNHVKTQFLEVYDAIV